MSSPQLISTIAEEVRRHQDGPRGAQLDVEGGLDRLEQACVSRKPSPIRFVLPLVAAAAALCLIWLAWPQGSLTMVATSAGPAPELGKWIIPKEPTALRFSDGTAVTLAAGSRAKVTRLTAHGGLIRVERGQLVADVRSREQASWLFEAGPFAVEVVGTAFDLSWNPVSDTFLLVMREGIVKLRGPVVGEGRTVAAPERVQINVGNGVLHSAQGTELAASSQESAGAQQDDGEQGSVDSGASGGMPSTAAVPTVDKQDDWKSRARAGEHVEAPKALRRAGVANVLGAEDAPTLLSIAQTARLGRDPALAAAALKALRRRFPKSVEAATASFLIGKTHHDRGRYAAAVTELRRYLGSAPGGAFAREARVLLILALHGAGDRASARAMARAYLAAHPNDAHTPRMQEIAKP